MNSETVIAALRYAFDCELHHASLGALSSLALLGVFFLTFSIMASSWRGGMRILTASPRVSYSLWLASFGLGMFGHVYADSLLWPLGWWAW